MTGIFRSELQMKINLTSHFSEVTEKLQMFLAPRLSFNYNDFLDSHITKGLRFKSSNCKSVGMCPRNLTSFHFQSGHCTSWAGNARGPQCSESCVSPCMCPNKQSPFSVPDSESFHCEILLCFWCVPSLPCILFPSTSLGRSVPFPRGTELDVPGRAPPGSPQQGRPRSPPAPPQPWHTVPPQIWSTDP